MSYELDFKAKALKEFQKLNPNIREYFKKKLRSRLENPHVKSARIGSGDFGNGRYKIKLRNVGCRLVYDVDDRGSVLVVVIVASRDKVYDLLKKR